MARPLIVYLTIFIEFMAAMFLAATDGIYIDKALLPKLASLV
jgi:hypothetical protein